MKKFFLTLTIFFCMACVNAEAAAQFTNEQQSQMLSIVEQKSAAAVPFVDIATFQKNFNAFMEGFIKETNAGEDADKMRQIFLIDKPQFITNGERVLFVKNFMNMVALVGVVDPDGNFTAINFFGAQVDDKNAALIHTLILQAFVKGISPDLDATDMLVEAKENPVLTKGTVQFSFETLDNLNVVSAVAAK